MRLRSKFLDADLTDEGGSFTEFDWSNRRNRLFYRDKPFAVESFRNGGECGVEVRGSARGGGKDFLQIEKKYTISDDSTALKVDYRFGNMPAAMSALIYGLHIHTTLGIFGSMCAYYLPSVNGIVEVKRGLRPGSTWVHYPSRGWIAALDEHGRGVAITMPFREVKRLFAWISQTPVPTLEWQMIPVSIENGKHYDVPTEVIVFKGLEKVSGAGGGLVGEISGGKAKVFNSRPHLADGDPHERRGARGICRHHRDRRRRDRLGRRCG